jgi:glycosyltransferase involved in cell wall biosynthesis
VLFVSRTRYRLPIDGAARRKWDALGAQLELRVRATARGRGSTGDARFRLVRDRGLGPLGGPAFYLSLPFRIAGDLQRFRPEVVVAQSPYEGAAALLARSLIASDAGIVVEVHGDWRTATRLYGSRLRRVVEPLAWAVARDALRRADAVRTVGPFTSALVRGVGVEPAAEFTAYSDTSSFTGRSVVPLPDQPTALFIGVLERYKDVRTLAAAWRVVAERVPAAQLRVIGRGREHAVIEELVEALPGWVAWSREEPPEAIAAALDAATVLVLPSRSEGLPRVAIEAMARGRPVVGSDAGGIPDIVRNDANGLLVRPGDPAALASALERVLTDRGLAERLAAAAAADAGRWMVPAEEYAARMRALVDDLHR